MRFFKIKNFYVRTNLFLEILYHLFSTRFLFKIKKNFFILDKRIKSYDKNNCKEIKEIFCMLYVILTLKKVTYINLK